MNSICRVLIFFLLGVVSQQLALCQAPAVVERVVGGKRVGVEVDSVLFQRDSLRRDSISKIGFVQDSLRKDSVALARAERKANRIRLTQDTIKPGSQLLLSFIPGLGQVYNRQYWKTPTFIGMMGGFVAGGVAFGSAHKKTEVLWQDAVNRGESITEIKALESKMYNQQSASTIFYALAGATYLYSIADATFNFRGQMSHIRKATTLAALFPGAGFFYTRTYWRIPIYYGGFAVMGAVIDYNNRYYQRFRTAYNLVADGDPATVDEFGGRFSAEVLQNARDAYRRNRDFGIIGLAAVYLLSIIDTYVIATLKNWDVSSDLSLNPTLFDSELSYKTGAPQAAGLSLQIKF